jgi:hypothetical protein
MAAFVLAAVADDDDENLKVYRRVADLSDFDLHTNTRLNRATFFYVLDLLREDLERQNERNNAIPPDTQLLVALSFLASGCFQWVAGNMYVVSQTAVSSIIHCVVDGLVRIAADHIKFPSTVAELNEVKQDFFRYGGIRNTVGIIDCTHVAFQPKSRVGPLR